MTTLLLVRHADVHNPNDVIYGRLPRFRLSDLGREQAARLGAFLADEPIAFIYTSPQLRARQTAAHIARHHPDAPIRICSLLAEILTSWQGTPNSQVRPDLNFFAERRGDRDETLSQVAHRMQRFIRLMAKRHPDQMVVAVSHGDPILVLRLLMTGTEPTLAAMRSGPYPAKASITRIELCGLDCVLSTQYLEPPAPPLVSADGSRPAPAHAALTASR